MMPLRSPPRPASILSLWPRLPRPPDAVARTRWRQRRLARRESHGLSLSGTDAKAWRTAYRRRAVGRMLSAFAEPERSALRAAIVEVGLAKAATLVPAIEASGLHASAPTRARRTSRTDVANVSPHGPALPPLRVALGP